MPTALLYHAVRELPAGWRRPQRGLCVDPERFAWQLAELARSGYRTLTLDEFHQASLERLTTPRRILLTFDDAYDHVLDAVTPLLARHGFSAAMFAPWAHLGSKNDWDGGDLPVHDLAIASRERLRQAAEGPWEIASHGWRHVDLCRVEPRLRRQELLGSRMHLSELLGRPVKDLAYPYGSHDADVRRDAQAAGYRMAFAAGPVEEWDLLALPRRGVPGR